MGEPQRLYGLNALVLNAADGIGEAIARRLAGAGAVATAPSNRKLSIANAPLLLVTSSRIESMPLRSSTL